MQTQTNQKNLSEIPNDVVVGKMLVTPQQIVLAGSTAFQGGNLSKNKNALENLKNGKLELDKLSDNAERKLKRKIEWLMCLSTKKCETKKHIENYYRKNIAVITLTLPKLQYHGDKYIKRQMLNIFLTDLRKRYKNLSYVWKAEVSKNSNIHFHIIVNQFVHWKEVRALWLNVCFENGYGTRAESAQFQNGYPCSEVKGVEKVQNFRQYLLKYVAKGTGGRKIEGRIWSCSHDLTGLNAIKASCTMEMYRKLDSLAEQKVLTKVVLEHVTCYIGEIRLVELLYGQSVGYYLHSAIYPLEEVLDKERVWRLTEAFDYCAYPF